MNRDMPQHPSIFNFMSCLRKTAYQSSISTVVQVEKGRSPPVKRTIAAQALHRKSEEAEDDYLNGLLSSTELLRLVANHYDDKELHEILLSDAEELEESVLFGDPEGVSISKYFLSCIIGF